MPSKEALELARNHNHVGVKYSLHYVACLEDICDDCSDLAALIDRVRQEQHEATCAAVLTKVTIANAGHAYYQMYIVETDDIDSIAAAPPPRRNDDE